MKDVAPEDVPKYILGYTCANDITARDLQRKELQWLRSKSFDTFCPLGPWMETKLAIILESFPIYLLGQSLKIYFSFVVVSLARLGIFVPSHLCRFWYGWRVNTYGLF